MAPKNLMIRFLDTKYDAEYIVKIFWEKEIAMLNSVTLVPQITNQDITNVAYITIDEYCETETAYEFICRIKEDCYIILDDIDNYWILEKNVHNNGDFYLESFTKIFNKNYYYHDFHHEEDCQKTIKGLHNDYYSFEEARNYLLELIKKYSDSMYYDEKTKIQTEIFHIKNEIKNHNVIEKNVYVTLRKNQFCDTLSKSKLDTNFIMSEDEINILKLDLLC
jgi:hypothetical protein